MARLRIDTDPDADNLPPRKVVPRPHFRTRTPAPTVHRLYGFWRSVAEVVKAGAADEATVAALLKTTPANAERTILLMRRAGYLHRARGSLGITDRCRRELRHAEDGLA